MAAAHLLVSVTTTVRPIFFLALKPAQQLYQEASTASFRSTDKDVSSVFDTLQWKID